MTAPITTQDQMEAAFDAVLASAEGMTVYAVDPLVRAAHSFGLIVRPSAARRAHERGDRVAYHVHDDGLGVLVVGRVERQGGAPGVGDDTAFDAAELCRRYPMFARHFGEVAEGHHQRVDDDAQRAGVDGGEALAKSGRVDHGNGSPLDIGAAS